MYVVMTGQSLEIKNSMNAYYVFLSFKTDTIRMTGIKETFGFLC